MFSYFVLILIKMIILSQIQKIETLFVTPGDYSKEGISGLNDPECGLSLEPKIIQLKFVNKCFKNSYQNKTVSYFESLQLKASEQTSNRVFKGVDIRDVSESPWAVWVGAKKWFFNDRSCTGVLITPHWVMTAAHCFNDIKDSWRAGLVLTIGSNTKVGIKSTNVEPHSFHTNPGYPNSFKYDIALVKISGFFPSTTPDRKYFINIICLPERDEVNTNLENAFFYGYGIINDDRDHADYLQKGRVTLDPYEYCSPYFCGYFSDGSQNPCGGDSGGPLVQFVPGIKHRAVLLGIQRGIGPKGASCSQSEWSNWIPVSKNIDWILKTMK